MRDKTWQESTYWPRCRGKRFDPDLEDHQRQFIDALLCSLLNEVSHKVTVIYCLIVLISKCKSVLELKITVNEHFLPLLGTVSSTCFLGVGTSWYDTYVCDGLPQQARPATFFFPTRGCLVLLTSALPVAPRRFTLTRALPDPNLSPDLPHCICRRPPA